LARRSFLASPQKAAPSAKAAKAASPPLGPALALEQPDEGVLAADGAPEPESPPKTGPASKLGVLPAPPPSEHAPFANVGSALAVSEQARHASQESSPAGSAR
jgi:hypothetical protein